MNVNTIREDDRLTVQVEGRLDTNTAPQLEAVLNSELPDVKDLTFDFSKLDYISSAGLRILLSSMKTMKTQGEMRVRGLNDVIREIFDVTGFAEILTVEP